MTNSMYSVDDTMITHYALRRRAQDHLIFCDLYQLLNVLILTN